VIADIHSPTADRAVAVEDVKFKESEIGVRGPSVGHGADLPDWDSGWMWKEHCEDRQELQRFLAWCSVIVINQRSAKELRIRRFSITPLQLGQE
jgi:hypothetical protein